MFDFSLWTLPLEHAVAALAVGYALGSIPFGLLITKAAGTTDIRTIGSRNIGATNVLRTGRKGLAAATLVCDMLKGTAAALLAGWLWGPQGAVLAGLGAFVGHVFPVWLGFKGGKGVATYLGVLIGIAWPAALGFAAIWLGIAALTRYSSLAALIATALVPVMLWLLERPLEGQVYVALSVAAWALHRANIRRLLAGAEGRIGKTAAS
jgi:glycerol-3-phosphate acyltransferase PlsY